MSFTKKTFEQAVIIQSESEKSILLHMEKLLEIGDIEFIKEICFSEEIEEGVLFDFTLEKNRDLYLQAYFYQVKKVIELREYLSNTAFVFNLTELLNTENTFDFVNVYYNVKAKYPQYFNVHISAIPDEIIKIANNQPTKKVEKDVDYISIGRIINLMQKVKILPVLSANRYAEIFQKETGTHNGLRNNIRSETKLDEASKALVIKKLHEMITLLEEQ